MCSSLTLIYLDSLRLLFLVCLFSQKFVSYEKVIELCSQTQQTVVRGSSKLHFSNSISVELFLGYFKRNSGLFPKVGTSEICETILVCFLTHLAL